MKSIIRSAKPYYIYLILTGKKTAEVGKDCPKAEDWNRIVEMYCSKDKRSFKRIPEKDREWMRKYLGKVACRFVCDTIDKYEYSIFDGVDIDDDELLETMLGRVEINVYANGKDLYGWHITDLKIYDKPKELGEFKKAGYMTEEQWLYALYPNTHCHYAAWAKRFDITRPPQSWCYCEELRG